MEYPGSLHTHSDYSNLRGRDAINKVDDLFDAAIELGHNVLAITEHECISSAVKAEKKYNKIKENYPNFKYIRGNEIYLCRNGLNGTNFNKDYDRYSHFILLAKDLKGFHQICEISTRAWKRSYMSRGLRRVPTYYQDLFDVIGKEPGHIIASTACLGGALPTQILKGTSKEKLFTWCRQLNNLFGQNNFYLEMQPSKTKEQILVNKTLLEFSKELNIPYIITTDAHYLRPEDRYVHKIFLNAQNCEREVDSFYATTYMMSTNEIKSYFDYFSNEELDTAFKNIENIKNSCEDYTICKPLKIPQLKWRNFSIKSKIEDWEEKIPQFSVFKKSNYIGDQQLLNAVIEGIETHEDLQNIEAYNEIDKNLEMIWESSNVNNAHWSAYLLNLQNVIDICWKADSIVGPARGSGAGFLLLYVLGITQINPLRETVKVYPWRFLNPARVSPLDIDIDTMSTKRQSILNELRKEYGEDYVANVATFREEKSKSAIKTAARGLGIEVDAATYLSSLIPIERGQVRTLKECYYGNEEKGIKPVSQFVAQMKGQYQELWKVASKIEGVISGYSVHAGGVIFVDEPFSESTALMRAPDGTIITQFELHAAEDVSLIKYDLLTVEALDRIYNCLNLLCEQGYIERYPTLRETYENAIGIYKINRDNPEMWKMVNNHEIQALFQMDQQSGINGIDLIKPTNINDLAILNSVIRLMAPEKGAEIPLEMWARYRKDITQWYQEMRNYGLKEEDIEWLAHHPAIQEGICEAQEGLMLLVQEPKLGGHDLQFADKCRKGLAKKDGPLFAECEKIFYDTIKEKNCDPVLAHYVWDRLLRIQRNYSFNHAHVLAYSLIPLQEMNLAYFYPRIIWDCACLISDSGGDEIESEEEDIYDEPLETYSNEMEEFAEDDNEEDIDSSYEEEDCDGYPATVCVMKEGKKKKKVRATDYGRVAAAIGKIKSQGVVIAPPDINKSTYTFTPDVDNNCIVYGLSGITRISKDFLAQIIEGRPYTSLEDFITRLKPNKLQMTNLIKSGAFDCFGNRVDVMKEYIELIADTKKRITLQNMKMLIDFNLIPEKYNFEIKVFNFNKYLKKQKLDSIYYGLDNIAFNFYTQNFDNDLLKFDEQTESNYKIKQADWDKIYKHHQDIIRPFVKDNNKELLETVNNKIINDLWNKYCVGTISKWEMDSLSCYIHEHELNRLNEELYGWSDYFSLSEEPIVDTVLNFKGKQVPLYKIKRIAGTVLDRNKDKKKVVLLTTKGVVNVKIYGDAFAIYDRRISELGSDGHKHVKEESFFKRGNKIIVTGVRQGNEFIAKKYKKTPFHLVEKIIDIKDNEPIIQSERMNVED